MTTHVFFAFVLTMYVIDVYSLHTVTWHRVFRDPFGIGVKRDFVVVYTKRGQNQRLFSNPDGYFVIQSLDYRSAGQPLVNLRLRYLQHGPS